MPTDTRVLSSSLIASMLLACTPPLPDHPPPLDGSGMDAQRDDTGPVFVHDSGRVDAAASVDAFFDTNLDAAPFDAGDEDGGTPIAITLDGVIDEPFWDTVSTQVSTTTTLSPYDGDSLTSVHYGRDDTWLYIGVEGTLTTGDAIVLYVDTNFLSGVPLNGGLGDEHGVVNSVLSLPITSGAEFQPEWGWGTAAMPKVPTTGDASIGWRALAMSPSTFGTITANTRSACSATGCETAMLLLQLGVPTGGPISFIARLGRPSVGFSNQTFPVSDTTTPELVDTPIMVPAAVTP